MQFLICIPSLIYIICCMEKKYKEDKTKPCKTPFGNWSSSFSFLDSCHTGRAGQILLGAPYQRCGRKTQNSCCEAHGMPHNRNKHMVSSHRKIYGLDKDLMVHCPSMQRFGCNFWPNWKTAALFSITCRLKGGPALEQHVFRGFGSR